MIADTSLSTFKAITNFVHALRDTFALLPLKLYCRVIDKITLTNVKGIEKQINIFCDFCNNNRDAIKDRNLSKLVDKQIIYSQKVYIDLIQIFKLADAETTNIIWSHIINISGFVDPKSNAREILKEDNTESDFFANMINKIENNVDPNETDPGKLIASIANSGMLSEVFGSIGSGMQSGNLDITKISGALQALIRKCSPENEGDQASEMVGTLFGAMAENFSNMSVNAENGQPMDIGSMLGPMIGPMMGALTASSGGEGMPNLSSIMGGNDGLSPADKLNAKINKQVEQAKKAGEL